MVDVDFISFRITVLGDVRTPGSFTLPSQRNTLFEALAAAGDLQRSAKRHNIHLFRESNGSNRTVTRIDLRDKAVLYNKDLFQTKPNDVIYVQTRSGSLFREDFAFVATIITLLLSVFSIGYSIYNSTK
jgi:polysaccharide export outer membrane protein